MSKKQLTEKKKKMINGYIAGVAPSLMLAALMITLEVTTYFMGTTTISLILGTIGSIGIIYAAFAISPRVSVRDSKILLRPMRQIGLFRWGSAFVGLMWGIHSVWMLVG